MSFVKLANKFACSIEVTKGALVIDGKSIMSVMRLAATKGTKLKITSDGDDANEATEALVELVESGYGEETHHRPMSTCVRLTEDKNISLYMVLFTTDTTI